MIDRATVQRIKDTADIVEVVSDYVHLTRRGSNYMGLCPFHNERTPSFSVNKRRNFCYCFSCHKGGSPVNFIMEKEGVSYHDALLHLARKYGIKVEERELTDEEQRQATVREGLLIAADRAMRQMESDLTNSQDGRDVGLSYFVQRGITQEAIRKFHLGYAVNSSDHITSIMQREGFELEMLQKLGLTGKSTTGRYYDKFRGRVIFPIMNSSGKTVGFGGRDLQGGPAKYINSPESELYRKNHELYGIFQAKGEIVRQNQCYLVEGYLDVISMWQTGMQNVVASSGTALTDGQIALIHRFTENITLLYDGDSAGIKAALRGIDMLLKHKMNVKVCLLPDGHDPDSFARQHTPDEFREYIERNSTDIIKFKMRVLLEQNDGSTQARAAAINSVVESIACIHDDVARTLYVAECSRIMNVEEASVAAAVEKARYRVIEQARQERSRRQFENTSDDDRPTPSPGPQSSPPSVDGDQAPQAGQDKGTRPPLSSPEMPGNDLIRTSLERQATSARHPLQPVEHQMIIDLIRYGYMNYIESSVQKCDSDSVQEDAGEPDGIYTLMDFVNTELEADSLQFSDESFGRAFTLLYDHIDDYIHDLDEFELRLMADLEDKRQKGFDDIAGKSLSIDEIEREERKLQKSLEVIRTKELYEFTRYYPGDFLASHPEASMRRLANEAINEKHVLSALFTKASQEPTEEELTARVRRSLIEWKSEVVNQQLKLLQSRLAEMAGSDPEEEMKLMTEMRKLMIFRSRIANMTGDRVISPTR
ncbi:MAG: DNA primase [Bacteroides sp.]|nr:DNA primase [Bacteroides sp.]